MISVAETFLCFITTRSSDGTYEYFLGTNPCLVYEIDPDVFPCRSAYELIAFLSARYPGRDSAIAEVVNTYFSQPGDATDRYPTPDHDGTTIIIEICDALGISPPEELSNTRV